MIEVRLTELSVAIAANCVSQLPADAEIVGEQIGNLGLHEQTARFILFQLNQELSGFTAKLTHPYVAVQHPEVQAAIYVLQQALSHHLQLPKAAFQTLCEKAIFFNLKLLLNPVETVTGFFFQSKQAVQASLMVRYGRYFTDFDFIIQGIAALVQRDKLASLTRPDFTELAQRLISAYEQLTGTTLKDYQLNQLSDLVGAAAAEELLSQPETIPANNGTTTAHQQLNPLEGRPLAKGKLVDSIPIHKQFYYIQHLFGGSNIQFNTTLDALDQLTEAPAAEAYLSSVLVNVLAEPAATELRNLVLSRFTV